MRGVGSKCRFPQVINIYTYNFHPDPWGMIQFHEHIFSNGLVQPPTSIRIMYIIYPGLRIYIYIHSQIDSQMETTVVVMFFFVGDYFWSFCFIHVGER